MKNHKDKGKYFFVLLATLFAVAALDRASVSVFGDLTLAPPLSIIALGILAVFFSWRKVLLAVPPFAALSYHLIADAARFPGVRAASVGLAGFLACWAAYQRARIVLHGMEVDAILQNLSLPWVLSDESGNVNQISPQALRLISLDSVSALGMSYFSIFSPHENKGELIRKYQTLVSAAGKPARLALTCSRNRAIRFQATLIPMEFSNQKRVLTTLEPV